MKYKRCIVCVDDESNLDQGNMVVNYLNGLGIPAELLFSKVSGCMLEKQTKDSLLVCLSEEFLVEIAKGKTAMYIVRKMNRFDMMIFNFKRSLGISNAALGTYGKTARMKHKHMIIHMLILKQKKIHPLPIVIHEMFHAAGQKHCKKPNCLGGGYYIGRYILFDNCKKKLEKVKSMFRRKHG